MKNNSNSLLRLFIIFIIVFLLIGITYILMTPKSRNLESFQNSCICPPSNEEESKPIIPPYIPPPEPHYNPSDYNMCKLIATTSGSNDIISYDGKSSTTKFWYDADQHCINDPHCAAFTMQTNDIGDPKGKVTFYKTSKPVPVADSMWKNQNYVNFYFKQKGKCLPDPCDKNSNSNNYSYINNINKKYISPIQKKQDEFCPPNVFPGRNPLPFVPTPGSGGNIDPSGFKPSPGFDPGSNPSFGPSSGPSSGPSDGPSSGPSAGPGYVPGYPSDINPDNPQNKNFPNINPNSFNPGAGSCSFSSSPPSSYNMGGSNFYNSSSNNYASSYIGN